MPRPEGKSPLFKRIAKGTIQVIGGLGVGLLIAVLLVGWRLASGPVSISFLTPYIDRALAGTHQGAFDITFDDTILTWAGWERTLDIRVVNLRVKVPEGDMVATVPEVSISLSAQALLQGTIAPRSVEFFGPSLEVSRLADGQFQFGFAQSGESSGDFVQGLIITMLQDPDPARSMSYLKRIAVVAGEVTYIDHALGATWQAPSADASIERVGGVLKAVLDLDVRAGRDLAAFSVQGEYLPENNRIDLGVSFEDVPPAAFAELTDELAVLAALDLPLSGTVTLSVEQDGRIEGFGFDVHGRQGHVALPVALASEMGALPWAQRLNVDELGLSGRYDGARGELSIDNLAITPMAGEKLYLPQPFDLGVEVTSLETAFSYQTESGRLEIPRLAASLGGASLTMTAQFDHLMAPSEGKEAHGLFADMTVTASAVPFDRLPELWPEAIGPDARGWVLSSLSAGIADHATMSLALRPGPDGTTTLASLAGRIEGGGVKVDYLPPMAPATNASAVATFNEQRFDIAIKGGDGAGGLKVQGGDIALYDLNTDDPKASIQLDVDGPVAAALTLIDAEPLTFASDLGISPTDADGQASVHIALDFPLLRNMTADVVKASASATLTDAGLKGVMFDRDLSAAELKLAADNDELSVAGTGRLGGVPIEISWKHDFRDGALFLDRYELSGYIENVLNLDTLGVQVPDVLERYMSGGAQANVSFTRFNDGREALSAGIDLTNIELSAPQLGWHKAIGVPGNGTVDLRLIDNVPVDIPKFALTAPEMEVIGAVDFARDGKLLRVDIDRLRSGLTDISGSLTPVRREDGKAGLWELVLRGESLDARSLWDEFVGIQDEIPEDVAGEAVEDDFLAINAAVDVRTVVMHRNRKVQDLIGTLYRRQGVWSKIDFVGIVAGGAPVELLLDTGADGLRYLSITSTNAGSALRRLDLYDNMLGGTLDLKAAYTSPDKDAPLEGVMKINDFAMKDAPAFTKLIGIMSLTGILDALKGEGLNFDIAEAPFSLKGGVLELVQARASGPSIGVTASGKVDMDNRVLSLKGTVVPAYAINALLGKIPLIGELFTGAEKGGGLFAATYTMEGQGENVDITVNPLSALAPGVLRNIFTGSGTAGEIPKEPTPPE